MKKIYKVDSRYQLHSRRIIFSISMLIKYLTGGSFFTYFGFLAESFVSIERYLVNISKY